MNIQCTICGEENNADEIISQGSKLLCNDCWVREVSINKYKEDVVNHPKHYTNHPSGVECKDISKHFDSPRGQAIQYIWRCEDKGHPITDLKKAIFWLEEKIKMYEDAGHTK